MNLLDITKGLQELRDIKNCSARSEEFNIKARVLIPIVTDLLEDLDLEEIKMISKYEMVDKIFRALQRQNPGKDCISVRAFEGERTEGDDSWLFWVSVYDGRYNKYQSPAHRQYVADSITLGELVREGFDVEYVEGLRGVGAFKISLPQPKLKPWECPKGCGSMNKIKHPSSVNSMEWNSYHYECPVCGYKSQNRAVNR